MGHKVFNSKGVEVGETESISVPKKQGEPGIIIILPKSSKVQKGDVLNVLGPMGEIAYHGEVWSISPYIEDNSKNLIHVIPLEDNP